LPAAIDITPKYEVMSAQSDHYTARRRGQLLVVSRQLLLSTAVESSVLTNANNINSPVYPLHQ
jgi:hypothetical protein